MDFTTMTSALLSCVHTARLTEWTAPLGLGTADSDTSSTDKRTTTTTSAMWTSWLMAKENTNFFRKFTKWVNFLSTLLTQKVEKKWRLHRGHPFVINPQKLASPVSKILIFSWKKTQRFRGTFELRLHKNQQNCRIIKIISLFLPYLELLLLWPNMRCRICCWVDPEDQKIAVFPADLLSPSQLLPNKRKHQV